MNENDERDNQQGELPVESSESSADESSGESIEIVDVQLGATATPQQALPASGDIENSISDASGGEFESSR